MFDENAVRRWRPLFLGLTGVFLAMLAFGLYRIFLLTPNERTMGIAQKIMYVHVPSAWNAFFSFGAAFAFSVAHLATKNIKWDLLAHACVEVGTLFATFVLITGPLWGKPAWGTYWDWHDARLVTTLILWLIFLGYLMLRATSESRGRRSKLSAIVAIVGFCDVPIIHMSVLWWRTIHPMPVVMNREAGVGRNIDSTMLGSLLFMLAAFNLLFFILVYHRVALEIAREKLDALKSVRARRLEEVG